MKNEKSRTALEKEYEIDTICIQKFENFKLPEFPIQNSSYRSND